MTRKPPTKTGGWGKGRQYGQSRGLRLSPDLEEIIVAFAEKYEVSRSEAVRRLVLDGVHQRMDESMTSTADVLQKLLAAFDELHDDIIRRDTMHTRVHLMIMRSLDELTHWREPIVERINRINQQTDNLQERLDHIQAMVEVAAGNI